MSAVFHLLSLGTARDVFQRLDHAAIFVLIAGTFTPIHAILFRGVWRWGMLTFIWIVAAAGVTLKSVFFLALPEWLGISAYLAMGWLGAISMVLIARRETARELLPLLAGGIAYTLGAVLEFVELPPLIPGIVRSHELFHLAVIAGLACHWRFIRNIAPWSPPREEPPAPVIVRASLPEPLGVMP